MLVYHIWQVFENKIFTEDPTTGRMSTSVVWKMITVHDDLHIQSNYQYCNDGISDNNFFKPQIH